MAPEIMAADLRVAMARGEKFISARDFYERSIRPRSFIVMDAEDDEAAKQFRENILKQDLESVAQLQKICAHCWTPV